MATSVIKKDMPNIIRAESTTSVTFPIKSVTFFDGLVLGNINGAGNMAGAFGVSNGNFTYYPFLGLTSPVTLTIDSSAMTATITKAVGSSFREIILILGA